MKNTKTVNILRNFRFTPGMPLKQLNRKKVIVEETETVHGEVLVTSFSIFVLFSVSLEVYKKYSDLVNAGLEITLYKHHKGMEIRFWSAYKGHHDGYYVRDSAALKDILVVAIEHNHNSLYP